MNLQEMIDQVSDETRNTTVDSKITRWLNMAITDIATTYVFQSLHAYNQTAVGTLPDLTLGANFLWLKTMEIPELQRKLYPEDEQRLSEMSPDYRSAQGSTTHYYFNGPIQVGLYKVPDSIHTFTWSYQRRPITLVSPTDTCDLPLEWHNLVTQKATTYGYDYEGNDSGSVKSIAKERRILQNLGSMVYRRLDVVAVVGSSQYVGRPPRPKLPSNYPSSGY